VPQKVEGSRLKVVEKEKSWPNGQLVKIKQATVPGRNIIWNHSLLGGMKTFFDPETWIS
jgi:hypothetical protein